MRKKPWVFVIAVVFMLLPSFLFSNEFNILSFGAIPDGKTLNTAAIQAAIDAAHNHDGGRVVIPAGRFLSGSLVLKTGVELHLEKKATLLGSTNPRDYTKLNRWIALIMADHASNISISGQGTIDGQGRPLALRIDSLFYAGKIDSSQYVFPEKRPRVEIRPQILEFVHCQHISITGVTIRHAASWVQSYKLCDDIEIDDIRVDSDTYWNNDGIDIIDCKMVRITNSYINASDDGICFKSYPVRYLEGRPYCDSIHIENCTIRSSASAIKFGTASYGAFKNITIKKIKVFDTFRSAIALELYTGGFLENVLIEDVTAKNTGNAIFIRSGQRKGHRKGVVRNITIRNMKVEVPFRQPDLNYEIRGPALPFFHNVFPSSIVGIPGSEVQNVHLENVEITYPGRGNPAYAHMPLHRVSEVPEREGDYPEFSMFGELPAWGFYIRHVRGLSMKDVTVRIKKPDYRPAFVLDDVKDATLQSIRVKGDEKPEPIFLHEVERVKIMD